MYAYPHGRASGPAARWPTVARGALVSLVAVGFAYAFHHVGPLQSHAAEAILAAFAATLGVTMLFASAGSRPAGTSPEPVIITPAQPQLRAATTADGVAFCAALHRQTLPHGLFPSLGDRFMRAYYECFAASPYGVLIIAQVSGVDIGFVAGSLDSSQHRRWVSRRRRLRLAGLGLISLCARPVTAARFARTRARSYLRALRRTHSEQATDGGTATDGAAHLSHVATHPGARGLGAGAALVRAFEARAAESGAPYVYLTTLTGEAGAGSFYEALGWRRLETGLGFGESVFDLWVNADATP